MKKQQEFISGVLHNCILGIRFNHDLLDARTNHLSRSVADKNGAVRKLKQDHVLFLVSLNRNSYR
jgi:hypothetical protein